MELLTAAEIARRLDTPENTIRYHARRFDAFVPMVGTGRRRRYRAEALPVLKLIGEQLHAGVPAEEIETQLAAHYPVTSAMVVEPQPQQPSTTTQQPPTAMVSIDDVDELRSAVAALRSESADVADRHGALLARVVEGVDRQAEELRALRLTVERLESAMATRRRAPWWERIIRALQG